MVCSTDGCARLGGPRTGSSPRRAAGVVGVAATSAFLAGLAIAGLEQDDLEAPKVSARLVSPVDAVAPGQTVDVAFEFKIEPGWHVYWDGQNDTGFAPTATWTLPEGVEAGEVRWPTPKRYVSPGGILDHVYERELTLLVPMRIPDSAEIGSTIDLAADLEWLVCKDICIPEFAEASLSLPVTASSGGPSPAAARLERAGMAVPKAKASHDVRWAWRGDQLTISVPDAQEIAFYPARTSASVGDLLRVGQQKGATLRLPVDRVSAPELRGILQYWTGPNATESVAIRIPTAKTGGVER